MPMLQAILLSAGDFARGALHAKIFPEPIRMQLLDFYSRECECESESVLVPSFCLTFRHFQLGTSYMTSKLTGLGEDDVQTCKETKF